jgi:hypothetical protein
MACAAIFIPKNQCRVLPLWTRPLVAGLSFLEMGGVNFLLDPNFDAPGTLALPLVKSSTFGLIIFNAPNSPVWDAVGHEENANPS